MNRRRTLELPADGHALLRRVAARRPTLEATPRAEIPPPVIAGTTATIRLYDVIDDWGGYWGISAREIVAELDGLPDDIDTIELLINSPGGMVFEGIAIMNALRRHQARIVAVVEGIAASAASFIACSADEVVMMGNSELMIHDAWNIVIGNADDMREMADFLDHVSDNIASIYAERAGGTVAEWRDTMRNEGWYTAQEAVDAGLADRVDGSSSEASNSFDLSGFRYPGRAAAPAPKIASASADDDTTDQPPAPAEVDEIADPPVDEWASHDGDALELLNL